MTGSSEAPNGFLLVDKPRGPSSHQVTAWVRDLLHVDRAGHAGTLDPNVSGLLVVAVGSALKLLPLLLEWPKRYVALVTFHGSVPAAALDRVVAEFTGPIFQTPPVRSAVRRERRVRTIHRLEIVEREPSRVLLDVVADSGTYVRTLAVDLGDALGVGGNMTELRRVGTGPFTEADSVSLAALADAVSTGGALPTTILRPIEEVWREFPVVVIRDAAASAVAHGADLARGGIVGIPRPYRPGAHVVLVTQGGELIAIGRALTDSERALATRHGWVVDATRVMVDPKRFAPTWRTAMPGDAPPSAAG